MFKYKSIEFIYRNIIKRIFFKFDPEFIHDLVTFFGNALGNFSFTRIITGEIFNYNNDILSQEVLGLKFKNPIGLSAGFDKNAKLVKILPYVGFGFLEIGSVTMYPYQGNPKPRLYRLPKTKGLVVYYGLMNEGVVKIVNRLKKVKKVKAVLGISIAKTNSIQTSTVVGGIQDYYDCIKYLQEQNIGDYYTINISCPNTFGGEPFTTKDKLNDLLKRISSLKIAKPIFIKMPINLEINEFDELLQVAIDYNISGVIIGNLNKTRDPNIIKDYVPENIKGGVSGKPTEKLSNELISFTYKKYKDKLIIIGVGGIFSAVDAYEKIKRGATLLQLITGMIFNGPQLIGQINKELVELLIKDGYSNIADAIGAYYR